MTARPLVNVAIWVLVFLIIIQIGLRFVRAIYLMNDRRKTFCIDFQSEMESYPTKKEQWELRKYWVR